LPICFYAFQAVFKEFDNIEITSEEIKAMFGPSETGIIRENLMNRNYVQAIEMYYQRYSEYHQNLVKENKDIKELLLYLKREGYKLAIVTGKARRSLEISLDCLNMKDVFDVIITGDDVELPKPNPEGINKVLSILNIKNNEAVFLGDSGADVIAGLEAQVYTIGAQWLPNYQSLEFNIKPNQLVKSASEFRKLLIDVS
jgi:pyrophosphatase PpaX